MLYTSMKHIHLLAIALSVLFLTVRYILMMMDSPLLQKKFFKVTPHVVDTILLASGISLIFITGFIPFTAAGAWLTEKITCVLVYIALGFVALKLGRTKLIRSVAFFGALGWLYWAAHLAMTKVPTL
ncbi:MULTISPECIES: SirB2 family protein [Vibrio]|uniref:Invasion protein n=1 Tax=Vibrio casei TaxID=673372 RepID=A0A368LPJ1_9VIBR|nr:MULTISPECIES: SirB2 family protein [Vibrio]RCS73676.1 invasion protein [Vibrio casei]SJN16313.1 Protein sirB2 [Vibrio casei]HBV75454.1 invasion protein [Vibrio sp.]